MRAALEGLAEVGYDRLTMDSIAAKAHAGKGALYRRWTSKAALVVDAVVAWRDEFAPARAIEDTGSIRGDLDALLAALPDFDDATRRQMAVFAGLVSAAVRDPELRALLGSHALERPRQAIETVLARAVAHGEVPPDRPLGLVPDLVVGLNFIHMLTASGSVREYIGRVFDEIVVPLATSSGPKVPGRAPDRGKEAKDLMTSTPVEVGAQGHPWEIANNQAAPAGKVMIEVDTVSKRFGGTLALDRVSFAVEPGKVLALLGPNGAGKTTLVRILTTLLQPDSGHARVAGLDVGNDARTVRSMIGLAGQYASVDELLTGRENLQLIGLLYHLDKAVYRRRTDEALERMSLTAAGDRPVKTYSGGMRRRLDLAASLIGRPPVLFLDEPTTGLDPRTRNDLWQLIDELVTEGTTVLLTTQYMEEAEHLAHGIVVLDTGRVVAAGTADQLKDHLGGNVLEVRVSNRSELEAATSLISDFGSGPPRLDPELNQVLLPVKDGTRALIAAGRALEDKGIALDDLGIRRPSLDDVFLAFTGRRSGPRDGPDGAGTDSAND